MGSSPMPREPTGIPGTATPRMSGASFCSRSTASSGTCPQDGCVTTLCTLGYAVLSFDRVEIFDFMYVDFETGICHRTHPGIAAVAARVLVDRH